MSDRAYARVRAKQKTEIESSPHISFLDRPDAFGQHTLAESEHSTLRAARFGYGFSKIPIYPPTAGMIQTKQAINEPGDQYEQEADRVAAQVMLMTDSESSGFDDKNRTKHSLMRKQSTEGANAATASSDIPPGVRDVLNGGGGRPLDTRTRAFMEPRFGHDFSQVRVHNDERAMESARSVNALAYTVGRDVVFEQGRYTPETNEGRTLLAHELTHVLQQTHRYPTNALSIQRAPAPKKSDWKPVVKATTLSMHVKVGETVSLKFHVSNEDTAPKGTTFDWRGILLNESDAIMMAGFSDHTGAHATLRVKGRTPGISEVGTTVYFKTFGAPEDHETTPLVRVEVGPEIAAAEAELAQVEKLYEKLHVKDKRVSAQAEQEVGERVASAQQEAVAAARNALGKTHNATGGEIGQIIASVKPDISKIENARYLGYIEALTDLNLTQFDEKEQAGNVHAFTLSLLGNLIWALSGLIAITPFGITEALAIGLIEKGLSSTAAEMVASDLAQLRSVHMGRVATAVGVGGAMLAQFASGPPSGSSGGSNNVSGPLIQLHQKLKEFNSYIFNAMDRELYSTLLALLRSAPPTQGIDAQQYAGRLELGVRRSLFGGYYENGSATGNQINSAAVQQDARNQLLRRLVVASGKISGEGIASTKLDEPGLGHLVEPAVNLVGGAKALELRDYELVTEQLQRMVRELGLEGLPSVNADLLHKDFAESKTIMLSARVTDAPLFNERARGLVEFDPRGVSPWVTEVLHIEIGKKDLTSAKIGKGGTLVYSAEKFRIRARGYLGAAHMEDETEQIHQGPILLWLIYDV